MNIDNMKRLVTHLNLEQQAFDYSVFTDYPPMEMNGVGFTKLPAAVLDGIYHSKCGFVGCVAGMAASIAAVEDGMAICSTPTMARKWLDLTHAEAEYLFHGECMARRGWYETASEALDQATAEQAAKMLQECIDAGRVV